MWWCAWKIMVNPSARCVSLEKSLHNCDCTISSSVWAHTHIRLEHSLNKGLSEKMRANTVKEDRSQIIISSTFYKRWPVLSLPEELNCSQALIPLFITASIRPDDLLWKTTSHCLQMASQSQKRTWIYCMREVATVLSRGKLLHAPFQSNNMQGVPVTR